MKKRNIYAQPLTDCCILPCGLCQFGIGSNANPEDAWAPGRKKVSFTPESTGR